MALSRSASAQTTCACTIDIGVLILIDYSSLLYRAFHSLPDTVATRGVYGFVNMLARLLLDRGDNRS